MTGTVYITGMGMVSGLGLNVAETRTALLQSRSGIAPIQYLETRYRQKLPCGEVKATNQGLQTLLKLPKAHYSRTTLLGLTAAREAALQARLQPDKQLHTGLISATSVGGLDRSELFFKQKIQDNKQGNLSLMLTHDCGDSTEVIAKDLQINGFITTISTACSSAANAILLGTRMIKQGLLDRVMVGGTDALTAYTLNGFKSLKILDESLCRPFDNRRAGLNLGEGAAFLVLESEKSLKITQNQVLGIVKGYGNANDAYHQTASSPEGIGALKAMRIALQNSNLEPADIDYINAHGTATPNNDLSEGRALQTLFGEYLPPFSSTKSFTGHTLAPAGAIEAVLSVLAIQHRLLIPNLHFREAMEELPIEPVGALEQDVAIRYVLSNSFGFGGNCTSLIFGATEQ